jgi:hypothetical protein
MSKFCLKNATRKHTTDPTNQHPKTGSLPWRKAFALRMELPFQFDGTEFHIDEIWIPSNLYRKHFISVIVSTLQDTQHRLARRLR